jgi:hypothetical protein
MTEKILSFDDIEETMTEDDYGEYGEFDGDDLGGEELEELEYDEEGGLVGEEY